MPSTVVKKAQECDILYLHEAYSLLSGSKYNIQVESWGRGIELIEFKDMKIQEALNKY